MKKLLNILLLGFLCFSFCSYSEAITLTPDDNPIVKTFVLDIDSPAIIRTSDTFESEFNYSYNSNNYFFTDIEKETSLDYTKFYVDNLYAYFYIDSHVPIHSNSTLKYPTKVIMYGYNSNYFSSINRYLNTYSYKYSLCIEYPPSNYCKVNFIENIHLYRNRS